MKSGVKFIRKGKILKDLYCKIDASWKGAIDNTMFQNLNYLRQSNKREKQMGV
jgi:ABC-type metal ion transport system substrate-binding protein